MSFINIQPPTDVLSFCLTSNKKAKIFIPSGVVYTQKTQWAQIFDDGNDSQELEVQKVGVKHKVKLIMPSPCHVVGVNWGLFASCIKRQIVVSAESFVCLICCCIARCKFCKELRMLLASFSSARLNEELM